MVFDFLFFGVFLTKSGKCVTVLILRYAIATLYSLNFMGPRIKADLKIYL